MRCATLPIAVCTVFLAAGAADSTVSYKIWLVERQGAWQVYSISRRLHVALDGCEPLDVTVNDPGITADDVRAAVAAVAEQLQLAETISGAGLPSESEHTGRVLDVYTRDGDDSIPCGRIFRAMRDGDRWTASETGRWVY